MLSRRTLFWLWIIGLGLTACSLVVMFLQRDVCIALVTLLLSLNTFGAFAQWYSRPSWLSPVRVETIGLPGTAPESTDRQTDKERDSLREKIRRERYVMAFADGLRTHVE